MLSSSEIDRLTRSKLLREILTVVADGKWHHGWKIAEVCSEHVSPERAYRVATHVGRRRNSSVAAIVRAGRLEVVHMRLWELAKKEWLEKRGAKFKGEYRLSPTLSARIGREKAK